MSSDELGATEESKGEATDGDEDDFEDEIIEKNEVIPTLLWQFKCSRL